MRVSYGLRSFLSPRTIIAFVGFLSFAIMITEPSMGSGKEEENMPPKTVSKKKKTRRKEKEKVRKEKKAKKLDVVAQVLQDSTNPGPLINISTFMDIETLANMRLTSHLWQTASNFSWTKCLAERDHLEAQIKLAQMYKEGSGEFKPSENEASYWYERVARTPSPFKEQRRKLFILSVDGGGTRGLIPARVIQYWEERLAEEFGFDVHMADFVDVIAGTSTGSIIVLGLTVPTEFDKYKAQYQASKLAEIYEEEGLTIFPQPKYRISRWAKSTKQVLSRSKFKAKPLEETLERYFQSIRLSQAAQNIDILVPAYNLSKNEPMWFDGSRAKENPDEDFMMQEVARCSAAAPTYLRAGKIKGQFFVDGGILKNDPSHKAFMKFGLKSHKKVIVISLGTGEENKDLPVKTLKKGGDLQWASHIAPIMMAGIAKETEDDMHLLEGAKLLKYYRIQTILAKAVLDDASQESMESLNKAARDLIENDPQIQEVYQELAQICLLQSQILNKKIELLLSFPILNFSNLKVGGNRYFSSFNENLHHATQLTHLHLRRCGLTADHAEVLCKALNTDMALIYLDLSENGIGPTGVSYLGEFLKTNKSLTELDLHCNGIGKGASDRISSLFKRKRGKPTFLIKLDLSDNDITLECFAPILQALEEVKETSFLRTLNMQDNEIQLSKTDKKKVKTLKKKKISILFDRN